MLVQRFGTLLLFGKAESRNHQLGTNPIDRADNQILTLSFGLP
jgi:hypothetical protein